MQCSSAVVGCERQINGVLNPCWEAAGMCRAWTSVCGSVLGPTQGSCHGHPGMTEQESLRRCGVPGLLETQPQIYAEMSHSQCYLRVGEDELEGLKNLVKMDPD